MAYLLIDPGSLCCLANFFIWDLNSLYFSASISQSGSSSPPEWIVKIIGIANSVRILAMSSHCRSKYFNQEFFQQNFPPSLSHWKFPSLVTLVQKWVYCLPCAPCVPCLLCHIRLSLVFSVSSFVPIRNFLPSDRPEPSSDPSTVNRCLPPEHLIKTLEENLNWFSPYCSQFCSLSFFNRGPYVKKARRARAMNAVRHFIDEIVLADNAIVGAFPSQGSVSPHPHDQSCLCKAS